MGNFTFKFVKITCVYLTENVNTWICPRCGLSKIKKSYTSMSGMERKIKEKINLLINFKEK
jgi:ribosomal protein L37AE/L43A